MTFHSTPTAARLVNLNVKFMNRPEPLKTLSLGAVETLAFAGGGNRCWWQAGIISQLLERGWRLPIHMVATSAGAGVAAACLTDGPKAALEACKQLYAQNARIFEWRSLSKLKLRFAHEQMYPQWIASFINDRSFEKLQNSPVHLRVAITRPALALGLAGSVAAGMVAYIVDKHIWNSIHPRLPRFLGLRQDFVSLRECVSIEDAQAALVAAAAAPPFMPARYIKGQAAIDGGFTDNAPIPLQSDKEKSRTLVLLTRHYPQLPELFRWRGRFYWQPKQRVPVSTWDCTPRATVDAAFLLGSEAVTRACETGLISS